MKSYDITTPGVRDIWLREPRNPEVSLSGPPPVPPHNPKVHLGRLKGQKTKHLKPFELGSCACTDLIMDKKYGIIYSLLLFMVKVIMKISDEGNVCMQKRGIQFKWRIITNFCTVNSQSWIFINKYLMHMSWVFRYTCESKRGRGRRSNGVLMQNSIFPRISCVIPQVRVATKGLVN